MDILLNQTLTLKKLHASFDPGKKNQKRPTVSCHRQTKIMSCNQREHSNWKSARGQLVLNGTYSDIQRPACSQSCFCFHSQTRSGTGQLEKLSMSARWRSTIVKSRFATCREKEPVQAHSHPSQMFGKQNMDSHPASLSSNNVKLFMSSFNCDLTHCLENTNTQQFRQCIIKANQAYEQSRYYQKNISI